MTRKKQTTAATDAPRTKHLLIVDGDLHARCEAIATTRRKKTGAATPLWSHIAREAMEAGLRNRKP
ncbi:MAG: hypothetical protein QM570_04980 [Planctomycetota bacterium]|nr:hypothetical protein [Planctomycetota bacterium]